MELTQEDREQAWVLLADLFFLDTEPSDMDWKYTADRLKDMGLGREEIEEMLVREVAPVAGGNLGYLLYPVIGAWAGFGAPEIVGQIKLHLARRARGPQWRYRLEDRFMRWMVRRLEPGKLWRRM
jgi:hypothetical protein